MTPADPLADLAGPELTDYLVKLDEFEGRFPWMYADVPGNVTAGVGHLIANVRLAGTLGFAGGDPEADWKAVKSAKPGLVARAYAPLTKSRLPDEVIEALKQSDLGAAQKELVVRIPDSRGWPIPVRVACLDMSFNLGARRFQTQYFGPKRHFGPACARGDWATAALQSARRGIQQSRNDYAAALIRSAIPPSVVT